MSERKEKFTPGLWQSHKWRVIALRGEDVTYICDTANNKSTRTPENEANASLIAAAPEMYDFIKEQVSGMEHSSLSAFVYRRIHKCTKCEGEKLLVKARGESQ